MFGIKLDLKKLAIGAVKIVGPAVVVAVVTHTSVKKAAIGAVAAHLNKEA